MTDRLQRVESQKSKNNTLMSLKAKHKFSSEEQNDPKSYSCMEEIKE